MKRVLVAEDEDHIREFVVINLRRAGYEVTEAADGLSAIARFDGADEPFDVALLDIMMPGVDGVSVCRHIREKTNRTGIIMLTAKAQETDKVSALAIGADDYVTKPFNVGELMARVDSLHRRVSAPAHPAPANHDGEIRRGEFLLNHRARTLHRGGRLIDLTQVEFQIMGYFLENPGVPIDRPQLLTRVWGENYYGDEKIVDVNIRRLRMKIEDDPGNPRHIITVWGRGYRWE
ncbi:MAG: response regulator transcription factor [Oscillospiraceae bacterium]|nr:response regulator transcription factor [Oscillospiraceae bacterium]